MLKSTAVRVAALLLTAAGLVGGCGFVGPSLDSFYTPATVVADDNLVGVWESGEKREEGKGNGESLSKVAVTPLGKGHYRVEFLKGDGTPSGDATVNATLFKLGAAMYIDVTLAEETRNAVNDRYFGMVLFPHFLMRIDVAKDEVQLYSQDLAQVVNAGGRGEKSPFSFRPLVDGDRPKEGRGPGVTSVLTGTPEELQRAVTVAESRGLFTKSSTLKRVRPVQK